MIRLKKLLQHITLPFIALSIVTSAHAFTLRHIKVVGNERIPAATVLRYLPVHPGQELTGARSGAIMNALYQTGFFQRVSLGRDGNTLVIHVVERATIGQLKITGNSAIPTDKLKEVMKGVGIAEGLTYNDVIIDKIRQSLLNQYYLLGRYNARVDIKQTPLDHNRLAVTIAISEGLIAKIDRITIIGAHAFSESTLLKQLDLTTPGLFTVFTSSDQFSQDKLQSSIEKLRNYYMDRGYIHFTIQSSKVQITPDRKSIYLTIAINEGSVYKVSGVSVAGQHIVANDALLKAVNIANGSLFSRQAVLAGEKAMSDVLGDRGYIYATVDVKPAFDEAAKTVQLNFLVNPGKLIYVRHIFFIDNTRTNDNALRRQMLQMEAAPVSSKRLEQSKERLNRLPYVSNAEIAVQPVANHPDQVDVGYKFKENSAAQANFGISYGQVGGFGLLAGLNQKNFLGTGNTLGFNFSRNRYIQTYAMNYTNPFYTPDGVSRSFDAFVSKTNPRGGNLATGFTTDQYHLGVTYGFPVGADDGASNQFILGAAYDETRVNIVNGVDNQVLDFVARHGHDFRQLELTTGFSHDTRNSYYFPTTGNEQSVYLNVFAPLGARALKYYKATYDGVWYQPIIGKFVGMAHGGLGYGNSFNGGATNFPFFSNYYAGGFGSVRGYTANTLGPKDNLANSIGGNEMVDGSVGIIFPNPFPEHLRTTLFFDAGNVYNSYNNRRYGGSSSGPLRYATGIDAEWLIPMWGQINLAFGKALNHKPGDDTRFFDFTMGTSFG